MPDHEPTAQPRVELATDRMSAFLVLPPRADDDVLTPDFVCSIARDKGVALGPHAAERIEAILASHRESPREMREPLAEGVPAVDGEPARVDWADGCDPEAHADTDEDGRVDHYNAGVFISVREGQTIARVTPPGEGTDGANVLGEVVRAKPGRRLQWDFDRSSIELENDVARAKIGGVLLVTGNKVKVTNLLDVSVVDFHTGNVSAEGSVHVRAAVKDRFEIRATEDVVVDGLVEAATIDCGGNLVLRRGMAARDQGRLRVKGGVEANYLNAVRGAIEGDLTVRRELINCRLSLGGDLIGDGGAVIGGRVAVAGSVRVGSLGSPGEAPTRIVLGTMPILVEDRAHIERETKELEATVREHADALEPIRAGGRSLSAAEKERLTELNYLLDEARQRLTANLCKLEEIDQLIAENARVDLTVLKEIHPKVVIEAGGIEIEFIRTLTGPVRLGWNADRRLVMKRGNGPFTEIRQFAHVRRAA